MRNQRDTCTCPKVKHMCRVYAPNYALPYVMLCNQTGHKDLKITFDEALAYWNDHVQAAVRAYHNRQQKVGDSQSTPSGDNNKKLRNPWRPRCQGSGHPPAISTSVEWESEHSSVIGNLSSEYVCSTCFGHYKLTTDGLIRSHSTPTIV